jgi:hypothetical protein
VVVISINQTWSSYFLSMPCIYDEQWLLLDKGGISNKMSLLNVIARKRHFKNQSCRSSNFVACYKYVVLMTLCKCSQLLSEHSWMTWRSAMWVKITFVVKEQTNHVLDTMSYFAIGVVALLLTTNQTNRWTRIMEICMKVDRENQYFQFLILYSHP